MEKLPLSEGLFVESSKITDYLLNLDHPVGGAKAKWFLKNGFNVKEVDICSEALKTHARSRPVVEVSQTDFGKKFRIECSLEAPKGETSCLRAIWIIEGEAAPRLVSAYPIKRN